MSSFLIKTPTKEVVNLPQFGYLLHRLVDYSWREQSSKKPTFMSAFFDQRDTEKAMEIHRGEGEIPAMQRWDAVGKQVHYASVNDGFQVGFVPEQYTLGLEISAWDLANDLTGTIRNKIKQLPESERKTVEAHAANFFRYMAMPNNALGKDTRLGDGQPLLSESHRIGPSTSQTWSNKYNLPLNSPNVDFVAQKMTEWLDDTGMPILTDPKWLITSRDLDFQARQIVGSDLQPENANNGSNPLFSRLRHFTYPFLGPDTWFLIDPMRMKEALIWYWRFRPMVTFHGMDKDKKVFKWDLLGAWDYGAVTWTWIAAGKISAATPLGKVVL